MAAAPVAPVLDLAVEAARVGATMRLAFARVQHPELVLTEASARLGLAAAIMAQLSGQRHSH